MVIHTVADVLNIGLLLDHARHGQGLDSLTFPVKRTVAVTQYMEHLLVACQVCLCPPKFLVGMPVNRVNTIARHTAR